MFWVHVFAISAKCLPELSHPVVHGQFYSVVTAQFYSVFPAKAGTHNFLFLLDSRLRGNDGGLLGNDGGSRGNDGDLHGMTVIYME